MYISQDPIRLRGGQSLYSYVKNTNAWVDIFGLQGSGTCDEDESLTKEEGLEKAQEALDKEIENLEGLSNTKKSEISTMVGATNLETGESTVGTKKRGENYGKCAEDIAVEQLGGNSDNVVFTEAYRPRTEETVPVCKRCQTKYSRDQFSEETQFE